ncbi:MAG: Wzt carbohydrate-binding domain-containing protein, partial [Nocardioidaceae bacterium]
GLGELSSLVDDAGDGNAAGGTPAGPPGSARRVQGRMDTDLAITGVSFDHEHAGERPYILTGESMTVRVRYHAKRLVDDVLVGINVYDDKGQVLFGANNRWYPAEIVAHPGDGEFTFEFDSVPLLDGTYPVTIGLVTYDEGTTYDWHEQQYSFSVMNPTLCGGMLWVPAVITERHPADRPGGTPATTLASGSAAAR